MRVDIYPLAGVKLEGEIRVKDHINLSGSAPRLGFNPITELYIAKHDPDAIIVACLKAGTKPSDAEAEVLKAQGVSAYSYSLLEPALYAAARGEKLDAHGYVPSTPQGFKVYGISAGLKTDPSKLDLGIIISETDCLWAGAFTNNAARAVCVDHNLEIFNSKSPVRAIVANAGNANACTGEAGAKADNQMREAIAEKFKLKASEVLTASTGKIGVLLPTHKIDQAIKNSDYVSNLENFAEAILTTDLVSKIAQDSQGHILGFTKGSGMIAPNMSVPQATMLGFLISDVKLQGYKDESQMQSAFRQALSEVADKSFNSISVDSDTSTNDMVLFLSSCKGTEISLEEFKSSLEEVCVELARKIVLDGEGATKLIELSVYDSSRDSSELRRIGKTIIDSPLVKTAIYGCDPNWGRIIAALGRAAQDLDLSQVRLNLLGKTVFENSMPSAYVLSDAGRIELIDLMRKNKVIKIDLHLDTGMTQTQSATVFGCDLSYDYVRINAEYFT